MCESLACYLLDGGVVSPMSVRPVAVDSLHIRDISFLLPFSCVIFFFFLPLLWFLTTFTPWLCLYEITLSNVCLGGTCSVNSVDLELPTWCQAQAKTTFKRRKSFFGWWIHQYMEALWSVTPFPASEQVMEQPFLTLSRSLTLWPEVPTSLIGEAKCLW